MKTDSKKDEAAINAKKALDEIQSLKSEVQKLTQSISCKQSEYTQKSHIKTDDDFEMPHQRPVDTDRTDSKFSMQSSQKQFGLGFGRPMHIESLDCLNSIQTTERDELNTLQPEREDNELKSYLTEKSREDKEELQQIERELKEKLEMTQKLLDQREDKPSLKDKSIT